MAGNRTKEFDALFTNHPGISPFTDLDVFKVFFGNSLKRDQNGDTAVVNTLPEDGDMIGHGPIPLNRHKNIADNRLVGAQNRFDVFLVGICLRQWPFC